jgi:PAS domain S-box-containing protein
MMGQANALHADATGAMGPSAGPHAYDQKKMHAQITVVTVLMGVFAIGLVGYAHSALAVLWLLANAAMGAILAKTDFTKDTSTFAPWRFVTIVGALVSVSLPLYISGQGEFTGVAISLLYLAANTVMVSSFDHDDKNTTIVIGAFSCALVAAPLVMGLNDPKGDWLPYIFCAFGAVMFSVQVIHARMVAVRSRIEAGRQFAEVQRQDSLTRMMFDTSSQVISLLDEHFRCVRVNKAFLHYYEEGTPIGRSYLDYLKGFGVDLADQFARSLAGETVRSENVEMRTPSGRSFFAGFETAPWREPNGSVVGIVCFSWDMTERVNAQRDVMRSFECLDIALHASNSVVLERDLITGERRWIGDVYAVYKRHVTDEMLDKFDPDMFPEESVAILKRGINDARHFGQAEFTYPYKVSGTEIGWLSVHAKYNYDACGGRQRLIYKITNITQKKREEQELLEALRRAALSLATKRSLLADLAHENGLDDNSEF